MEAIINMPQIKYKNSQNKYYQNHLLLIQNLKYYLILNPFNLKEMMMK